MGKGFETFMENPYWRGVYESAPTEELKEYELISTEELLIGAFKTSASILRHKKSGARIAVLENDDENKVFYEDRRTERV